MAFESSLRIRSEEFLGSIIHNREEKNSNNIFKLFKN